MLINYQTSVTGEDVSFISMVPFLNKINQGINKRSDRSAEDKSKAENFTFCKGN